MILVGVCCGYIITSYVLLKNPWLLHRPKRSRNRLRYSNIAHRGGAAENYENTLKSFHHAVAQGSRMLELDCHLTKDQVVVVSHDGSLKRLTGIDKMIRDADFKDLPLISTKLPLDFLPGQFFLGSDRDPVEWRRIAKLEEVFKTFPETGVNIDIKEHNPELIRHVSNLIDQYDRHDLTVWGNFRAKTTELCHETNPKVGLLFSFKRVIQVLLLFYTGLLPFVPLKETHFEVPMPSILQKTDISSLGTDYMGKARYLIVSFMDKLLMRPSLLKHLKDRGIEVYVWVLNSEEEFDKAFKCGVTGVMTDYPTKLKDYLICNPQYR